MKVQIALVGLVDHHRSVEWPEGWPIPREGEEVTLPGVGFTLAVRTVVWYPEGDDETEEPTEPFVYVVIGKPRPTYGR